MLGYITLLFSLSDFALSIGLSSQQATNLIGFLNIGTAIGRPMLGYVSDKLDRFDVTAGLTFICGLSCFAFWIPTQSYGLLVFFGIISGAVLGVFWMVRSSCESHQAAPRHLKARLLTPSLRRQLDRYA